ncbi:hypothetical protein CI102_6087 [Trichoderma harzianum]|nr:hypothetical protein CI102_6087 [Trichoderma harzianum]
MPWQPLVGAEAIISLSLSLTTTTFRSTSSHSFKFPSPSLLSPKGHPHPHSGRCQKHFLRRSVRNVVSVWREQDAQRVPEIQSLLIHLQLSLVEALRGALTDISFSAPSVLVNPAPLQIHAQ